MTTLDVTTEATLQRVKALVQAVTNLDANHVFVGVQDLDTQNVRDGAAWADVTGVFSAYGYVECLLRVFKNFAAPTPGGRMDNSALTAIGDEIIYTMAQAKNMAVMNEQSFGFTGPDRATNGPQGNMGAGLYVIEFRFQIARGAI